MSRDMAKQAPFEQLLKQIDSVRVHQPGIPFADAPQEDQETFSYQMVKRLSVDQRSYALWMALLTLFSHPAGGGEDILLELMPVPHRRFARTAHLILAQVGCSLDYPAEVEALRKLVEE